MAIRLFDVASGGPVEFAHYVDALESIEAGLVRPIEGEEPVKPRPPVLQEAAPEEVAPEVIAPEEVAADAAPEKPAPRRRTPGAAG